MLSNKQIDILGKYNFKLVIEQKEDKTMGTIIEMDGKNRINNVFLEDTLIAIADGLIHGEEQFESYKRQGIIKQDAHGNWNLNDHSAQRLAGDGVEINNNEMIEQVSDKKDLKGGIVDED